MFGWFAKTPTKASLHGHKTVTVGGMRFVIRQLSAFDFDPSRIPMVFSDTTRVQKPDVAQPGVAKRVREDMAAVIQAGVVDPPLAGPGKPELNVDDIFRDQEMALRLYIAIVEHSLLRFSGVRRPVFFLVRQLLRFTTWLGSTARGRAMSHSAVSA